MELRMTLAEQLRGLREGLFDAGFARTDDVGEGIVAQAIWHDPLVLAVPARHPLLIHRQVPWAELLRYPLMAGHPVACEGFYRQLVRLLRSLRAGDVAGHDVDVVAAGYGLGLMAEAQTVVNRHPGVVVRSIMDASPPTLTTYVLRPVNKDSEQLDRFIARLG